MNLPLDVRALWARVLVWYNGYSEGNRRVILGLVVATVLSLLYVGIVDPILTYRKEAAQEIAERQEKLERLMRLVGAKESLRAEREDLRKRLTQAKTKLLPGGTATLGAAALQERANALATEKGITVQSTQVMKEETVEPYRKVAVRLTLSGELKPLAELVSSVEYGQQLNVPFIEVSRRGAVAGAKGPRTLSVTVEVSGFVQGGAPSKTEAPETEAASTVEAQADGAGAVAEAGAASTTTIAGDAEAGVASTTTVAGDAAASTTTVPGGEAPATGTPPASAPITFPSMVIPTTAPATVAPPSATKPPAPPPPGDSDDDEDGE